MTSIETILKHIKAVPDLKLPWPKAFPDQMNALKGVLDRTGLPVTAAQAAKFFKGAPSKLVEKILDAMAGTGIIGGSGKGVSGARVYFKHQH